MSRMTFCFGGGMIWGTSAMMGPSGIWARHWRMIRELWRISSIRTQ